MKQKKIRHDRLNSNTALLHQLNESLRFLAENTTKLVDISKSRSCLTLTKKKKNKHQEIRRPGQNRPSFQRQWGNAGAEPAVPSSFSAQDPSAKNLPWISSIDPFTVVLWSFWSVLSVLLSVESLSERRFLEVEAAECGSTAVLRRFTRVLGLLDFFSVSCIDRNDKWSEERCCCCSHSCACFSFSNLYYVKCYIQRTG